MEYKGSLNGKKIFRHRFHAAKRTLSDEYIIAILKQKSIFLADSLESALNAKFPNQNVKCKFLKMAYMLEKEKTERRPWLLGIEECLIWSNSELALKTEPSV